MKKVVKILAAGLALVLFGFAGFVWWALQPKYNPLPLPDALIALDSEQGQALLASAEYVADYEELAGAFQSQELISYCGVASGVAVLNARGAALSQDEFFNAAASRVRSRLDVTFGGMSLPDLGGLVAAHGATTAVVHAGDASVDEFRATIERNLATEGDYLVVNYQREALGQGRVGHISPLAAYHRDSDRVLVMDTAAYKYPQTWVPVDSLFAAMQEVDGASGRSRGYMEVE
jgi:hypothetical protein